MTVHIQMIGTGSAFSKKYYNNSALLHGNGFKLLIDCGYSVPMSLHELQLTPDQLDGILITHLHADHTGGLEEIALRLCYAYGRKRIKLFIPELLRDRLWSWSLRGGLENRAEGFAALEDYFDVVPLQEGTPLRISEDLNLETIRTIHIPEKPSYSLFLNNRLFYSADMVFMPDLLKELVARGCRYILHDCQLSSPGVVHATLEELRTLPESIQKLIYLMHYSDEMEQYQDQAGPMTFLRQHTLYTFE